MRTRAPLASFVLALGIVIVLDALPDYMACDAPEAALSALTLGIR